VHVAFSRFSRSGMRGEAPRLWMTGAMDVPWCLNMLATPAVSYASLAARGKVPMAPTPQAQ